MIHPTAKRRRIALLTAACLAASLQSILFTDLWSTIAVTRSRELPTEADAFTDGFRILEDEASDAESSYRRILQVVNSTTSSGGGAQGWGRGSTYEEIIRSGQSLPPYNIRDAVESYKLYDHTFALLVYDPATDQFYGYYTRRHYWTSASQKLVTSLRLLSFLLRSEFPERFIKGSSPELIIPVSSGDWPAIKTKCLFDVPGTIHGSTIYPPGWLALMGKDCDEKHAPILHFGSSFKGDLFPTIVGMPVPSQHHLKCMGTFKSTGKVCRQMTGGGNGLVHGGLLLSDEMDREEYAWENLIPQVLWRGTDFCYLSKLHPEMYKPQFEGNIEQWENGREKRIIDQTVRQTGQQPNSNYMSRKLRKHVTRAVLDDMEKHYDHLLPRWKAVYLTTRAGFDAGKGELPWANMRFSQFVGQSEKKTNIDGAQSDKYSDWMKFGLASGGYMNLADHAKFRYHIDLGGGGGTTWTGTIEKLGLPGLLFHHETPTKDYFYDRLVPWVHYVPIKEDLSDLKTQLDWAEAHPKHAKKISKAATQLVRDLTSREGYQQLYQEKLVEPLRRVVEAYQPLGTEGQPWETNSWRKALLDMSVEGMWRPIIQCGGHSENNCKRLAGPKIFSGLRGPVRYDEAKGDLVPDPPSRFRLRTRNSRLLSKELN